MISRFYSDRFASLAPHMLFAVVLLCFFGSASAQEPTFCMGDCPELPSTTYTQVSGPTVAPSKPAPKVQPTSATTGAHGGKDIIGREDQCKHAQPPPAAREAGLTKLAFCDDFSTDTLARGKSPESRDLINGKKWSTEKATRFGSLVTNPASDFAWNPEGTLSFKPTANQYQWAMSSTVVRNGILKGYFVDKKSSGFYAEIRWRMDKRGGGQPAFWSMDTCHLYGLPETCAARTPTNTFFEPDFWEYYNAITSLHYYAQTRNGMSPIKRCIGSINRPEFHIRDGQWFVAASLITLGQQAYYKDDRQMNTVWDSATCPGVVFDQLTQGQYPILIGSKMDNVTIDYVRVWEHPDDGYR